MFMRRNRFFDFGAPEIQSVFRLIFGCDIRDSALTRIVRPPSRGASASGTHAFVTVGEDGRIHSGVLNYPIFADGFESGDLSDWSGP